MEKEIFSEPKSIAYDYVSYCFGEKLFNEKNVLGAGIRLVIRAYKDGKEVKFLEEPRYKDIGYEANYDVTFDSEKLFVIQKNLIVDNLFRIVMGWDKIEAEIDEYFLDCLGHLSEEIEKDLPEDLKGFPCIEPVKVSEEEFSKFLRENSGAFGINNIKTQVPSVSFI